MKKAFALFAALGLIFCFASQVRADGTTVSELGLSTGTAPILVSAKNNQ